VADALSTYQQYLTAFKHGNLKPVYLFYGEERYLIDDLQKRIVDSALQPGERDFNLDVFYGSETDGPAVVAACAAYPMMAVRRLVIVRDFEKLARKDPLIGYVQSPNPSTVALFVCNDRPRMNTNPYRAIAKHAEASEFKALQERQLPGWVSARLETAGKAADAQAIEMFCSLTGNSLQKVDLELEKLITFVGNRGRIAREDVLQVGGHSREYNVFELQRCMGEQDFSRSAVIMERMLRRSSNRRGEASMILSVLTSYFIKLKKLSGCQKERLSSKELASAIGVPPYFVRDYQAALRRIGRDGLEKAFEALQAADYELKGGSQRGEDLILMLLLRRLTGGGRTSARAAA
jgi:DNA polymerase-3 subunit delta